MHFISLSTQSAVCDYFSVRKPHLPHRLRLCITALHICNIYLVHHSAALLHYHQYVCTRRQTTAHKSRYLRDYCCQLSDNMLADLHSRVANRPQPTTLQRRCGLSGRFHRRDNLQQQLCAPHATPILCCSFAAFFNTLFKCGVFLNLRYHLPHTPNKLACHQRRSSSARVRLSPFMCL